MGERARLEEQRRVALSNLQQVGDKIDALTTAKNNLEAYNTEISYKLSDNATIAETYHLDGTKYKSMTTDEKKLLTDLTSLFNSKRESTVTALEVKISSLGLERDRLVNSIASLNFAIAYAND